MPIIPSAKLRDMPQWLADHVVPRVIAWLDDWARHRCDRDHYVRVGVASQQSVNELREVIKMQRQDIDAMSEYIDETYDFASRLHARLARLEEGR